MLKKFRFKIFFILLVFLFTNKYVYALSESGNEYSKYELQPGLNIIAIDLGGPVNTDRTNGAFGDAAIIEQGGNYLLMDTGSDDNNNVLIQFLKSQDINHFSIYLSHYHSDHYGKIKDILNDNYFTVDKVYLPDPSIIKSKLDSSKEWYELVKSYNTFPEKYKNALIDLGANVVTIGKGTTIKIGSATLKVIWDLNESSINPDEMYNENVSLFANRFVNDTSLISMLTYKGIKYLNGGDIEKKVEQEIVNSNLNIKADILKFSHHGSTGSNTDSFVEKINPKYAYFPNNYTKGKNNIIWYGDRDNGKYKNFVDNLASKTNILSTLYNGNILYNISPSGVITTDATRNYHILTVKYIDKNTNKQIDNSTDYRFNDRSIYHLDKLNYIKNFDDYVFLSSTYVPNTILSEDSTVTCYYEKKTINVNYSTTNPTNKNVTVELKANMELSNLEGWTLSQDKKSLTKIYTKNITEDIEVTDLIGKVYTVNIKIKNIDKKKPTVQTKYSTTEHTLNDVVVTIEASEKIQKVEGWTLSDDKKMLSKTFTKNAEETITIYDLAGNSIVELVKVENIVKPVDFGIKYKTHVQTYGWQKYVSDGIMSGTVGEAKRLEAIKIKLDNQPFDGDIEYRTHIQSYGWEESFKKNDEISGTSGDAKRLEAIQIRLTGDMATYYDVYYRVHAQTYGWLGWARNGEEAGTAGFAKRLEGIEIKIIEKGQVFSDYGKKDSFIERYIEYNTHVQSFGWQDYVWDGVMSGTQGLSKRLEAITIRLVNQKFSGNVLYRTHVQSYGWENAYKRNGEMSGTSGLAKRLEAIEIKLDGEMSSHYDIYYRVHAQSYGWLNWAKNGEEAGTAGLAKRLEGIEIVLVDKGEAPPVRDNQNDERSFIG